jgi:hypothetical protein
MRRAKHTAPGSNWNAAPIWKEPALQSHLPIDPLGGWRGSCVISMQVTTSRSAFGRTVIVGLAGVPVWAGAIALKNAIAMNAIGNRIGPSSVSPQECLPSENVFMPRRRRSAPTACAERPTCLPSLASGIVPNKGNISAVQAVRVFLRGMSLAHSAAGVRRLRLILSQAIYRKAEFIFPS